MRNKNAIPAFTMIELIVVMLLTSILVTALWSSYQVIQNFFIKGRKQNESAERVLIFHNQLNEDFTNCRYVKKSSNEIFCVFNEHEIKYTFNNTTIIRTQYQQNDTLNVNRLNYLYTGLSAKHEDIIKGLDVSFETDKRTVRFLIQKQYDAAYQVYLDTQIVWKD